MRLWTLILLLPVGCGSVAQAPSAKTANDGSTGVDVGTDINQKDVRVGGLGIDAAADINREDDMADSPEADSGATPMEIPLDAIDQSVHEADCQQRVRCGSMPDVQQCVAATWSLLAPRIQPDLAAGKVGYDPAAGKALVDWVAAAPCADASQFSWSLGFQTHLTAAFPGTVPPGGSCCTAEQCAGSASCVIGDGGAATCAAGTGPQPVGHACAPLPPEGSNYTTNFSRCVDGAYCDDSAPSSTICRPLATVGMSCMFFGCATDLGCNVTPTAQGQVCVGFPQPGEACIPEDCDDPRTYCGRTTLTCIPRGTVGAACDPTNEMTCLSYAECDPVKHVCVAVEGAGAPCPASGSGCLGQLSCDSGGSKTCVLPPVIPGPCGL